MKKTLVYKFTDNDFEEKKVFSHIFPEIWKKGSESYIDFIGLKVYSDFYIHFSNECNVYINWIKARQDISQGVDVSIHNARLKICDGSNSETKSGFAFMHDRWFPSKVPLLCKRIKFRKEEKKLQDSWFMAKNIWEMKRSDGRMERCSWGGNYGVVIEQKEEHTYRLHFSCGEVDHPNVTFEDLVVDVSIEGEYKTRFQCSDFEKFKSEQLKGVSKK